MIRLFAGIDLPPDIRRDLAALGGGVPQARWIDADNLHLTLRFIGDVDYGQAEDIDDALSLVRAPAFSLVLRGVGHFGSQGSLRALWAGVDRNPALMHLHEKIESALVRYGLAPERRRFTPHVTLAWLRGGPRDRLQRFMSDNNLYRSRQFEVDRITLFSSQRGRSGARYRAEAAYPLLRGDLLTREEEGDFFTGNFFAANSGRS